MRRVGVGSVPLCCDRLLSWRAGRGVLVVSRTDRLTVLGASASGFASTSTICGVVRRLRSACVIVLVRYRCCAVRIVCSGFCAASSFACVGCDGCVVRGLACGLPAARPAVRGSVCGFLRAVRYSLVAACLRPCAVRGLFARLCLFVFRVRLAISFELPFHILRNERVDLCGLYPDQINVLRPVCVECVFEPIKPLRSIVCAWLPVHIMPVKCLARCLVHILLAVHGLIHELLFIKHFTYLCHRLLPFPPARSSFYLLLLTTL